MAKLKGPLLSIDASGHVGKAFAISHWKGIKKGMKHFKPHNPRTVLQQDNRAIMRYAVWYWQSLTDEQKWSYNQSAKNLKLKMSGYNYFLQTYIAAYVVAPPPPPGPILDQLITWWKFDENGGVTAYDAIGSNHGSITDANWVAGKSNSALSFNGTTAIVKKTSGANLPTGKTQPWSIEAWVYLLSNSNGKAPFGFGASTVSYGNSRLAYNLSGNIYFWGGHTGDWNTGVAWDIDDWQHIVFASPGNGTIYMYKNGTEYSNSATIEEAENIIVCGASSQTSQFCPCTVDEFRIYAKKLSLTEVLHNYNLHA